MLNLYLVSWTDEKEKIPWLTADYKIDHVSQGLCRIREGSSRSTPTPLYTKLLIFYKSQITPGYIEGQQSKKLIY